VLGAYYILTVGL
jgi:hypothetical protein